MKYAAMGKRECAMCRESIAMSFTFPMDQAFRDNLEKEFGYEFKEREKQVAS